MAVGSEENVFIASSLGSILVKFISSGLQIRWKMKQECLETFDGLWYSRFYFYVTYSPRNAEVYSEFSQISEIKLFCKNS